MLSDESIARYYAAWSDADMSSLKKPHTGACSASFWACLLVKS